jgi:alpha-beta hydrolase superfamily lysophospholipase
MPTTETHFELTANDGVTVESHRWQGATQRAVIQLAHGMGEHSLRYRHLADALVQAGYVVYSNEHRGHGKGASARGELGEFGPRGFAGLVDDMALLSRHVRGVHPGLPLILVGHSMGSFATQYYLLEHSALLAGAALSGTSALDLLGAALQSGFKLEDMNAALPDVRTPFDWLSRDPAQVDLYANDPLCGFRCTNQLWIDLLGGLQQISKASNLAQIDPGLPLLVIGGECDPVSEGKRLKDLAHALREAGSRNLQLTIYPQARHELFNESNRDEVINDVLNWIAQTLSHRRPPRSE